MSSVWSCALDYPFEKQKKKNPEFINFGQLFILPRIGLVVFHMKMAVGKKLWEITTELIVPLPLGLKHQKAK